MNLQPGNYNFDIYPGVPITESFVFEEFDGTLVDITGCDAILTFKYKNTPTIDLLVLSISGGGLVIDPVINNAGLPINAGISIVTDNDTTTGWIPGRIFHNLQLIQPNGENFIMFTGSGTIYQV